MDCIKIEIIAEKYGHKIIWTPPYHSEFNFIELMWGITKNYVGMKVSQNSENYHNIEKCRKYLYKKFQLCTPEVWKKSSREN
jgi:hypothetical protein